MRKTFAPGALRAVLFDLDGVLVDSTAAHRAAFEQVLAPYGIHDFVYHHWSGQRTPDVFHKVFARAGLTLPSDEIDTAARRKSALARQFIARQPYVPGVIEVIRTLASQFVLALASSGSRPSVEAFLTATSLTSSFSSILSGDDVSHAKPHPEIYQRTLDALNLPPDAALVIEDAVSGIQAALAAGAWVAALPGTHSSTELEAAGAHLILPSLDDLPSLLCLSGASA